VKQSVPKVLGDLKMQDWRFAVVYDTRNRQNRPIGHRWDYDAFLCEERALERLVEPAGNEFHDPELWGKDDAGSWEKMLA
jgi:hypothetical protein